MFSCDRWIPDVLCRSLGIVRGPHPILLGGTGNPETYSRLKHLEKWVAIHAPKPEPASVYYEYYVD